MPGMETRVPLAAAANGETDASVDAPSSGEGEPLSSEASVDEVDRVLDQVESALARLDEGTYGLCVSCGSAIDDAHLATAPTAQTCQVCEAIPGDDHGWSGDTSTSEHNGGV
jgi:DnaK suppressor protein